jgi:hypothetical protein
MYVLRDLFDFSKTFRTDYGFKSTTGFALVFFVCCKSVSDSPGDSALTAELGYKLQPCSVDRAAVNDNVIAVLVLLAWLKIFKYITFNRTMTQLNTTLSRVRK